MLRALGLAALVATLAVDVATAATYRVDDGATTPLETTALLRWRELVPSKANDNTIEGAVLVAVRLNPQCRAWLLFAHQGAEPGHKALLEALQAEPMLALGLRLGEGSGAALAVPLLRLACALHGQMATFAEAAVADRPA